MKPKVTLVNPPAHVLETIWILWEASKVDGPVSLDVEEVQRTVPRDKLESLFWSVIAQHIPVAEHINFVFVLEGVSVSFREQMVRHRIGCHVGDNYGVDIVPDLADSTWWSQSMRIQDMGTFADKEMYRVPESLAGVSVPIHGDGTPHNPDYGPSEATHLAPALQVYDDAMRDIQRAYKALVAAGVPMEDARELIPLGAQHRISWGLNLQALLHVVASKRACWILQAGIWGPIIQGMVDELATKVHPMFARIIAPPCIGSDNKFKACTYQEENVRRMDERDAHPPCPLWLCRDEKGSQVLHSRLTSKEFDIRTADKFMRKDTLIRAENLVPRHREMNARAVDYTKLWGHDAYIWDNK